MFIDASSLPTSVKECVIFVGVLCCDMMNSVEECEFELMGLYLRFPLTLLINFESKVRVTKHFRGWVDNSGWSAIEAQEKTLVKESR